jgi:hypothetical protein
MRVKARVSGKAGRFRNYLDRRNNNTLENPFKTLQKSACAQLFCRIPGIPCCQFAIEVAHLYGSVGNVAATGKNDKEPSKNKVCKISPGIFRKCNEALTQQFWKKTRENADFIFRQFLNISWRFECRKKRRPLFLSYPL